MILKPSFASAVSRHKAGKRSAFAKAGRTARKPRAIKRSAELARCILLPRRTLDSYDAAFALELSERLRRPGSDFTLWPGQAAMLVDALEGGGLLGMRGTGGGKTTVSPLFGHVLGLSPTLVLVPPQMKRILLSRVVPMLLKEIDFDPPVIASYADLSDSGNGDMLERIRPQLVVCDEIHFLKNKNAARTKRFVRWFDDNPGTVLVALSGSMTSRTFMDFHHFLLLTHKGWRCPVTRFWHEAKDWSLAIDPRVPPDQRMRPGALLELCRPGEGVWDGLRRRLLDTEGVIGGAAEGVDARLVIRKVKPEVPDSVGKALKALRRKWETPGGEQITDAKDLARKARELAQGFYYVWDWLGGEPDLDWLRARAAWREAVADVTRLNRPGLDSEFLVRGACARAWAGRETEVSLPKASRKATLAAWHGWEVGQAGKEPPPTRAVWIDDFLVRFALDWASRMEARGEGGLVWIDSRAVEARARELGALVFGPGPADGKALEALSRPSGDKPPSCFVSTRSHGTGKDLQHRWWRNLVLLPWPGGKTWEQTLARTHRPGQTRPEVVFEACVHTEELEKAIERALEDAAYIQGLTGGEQKLLQAEWDD